ncbi:MAG: DUF58 domain-containing protein [Nanoarchaeota archaeon]
MVELQLDFLPHLKRLEDLTKKPWLAGWLIGGYQSIFRGSGQEFEGYTQYTQEQDSKRIDWIASSKSDKLLMRTFIEERDMKCFVVMDTSSSMFFSSSKKLKCEYAAELANTLLFAVIAAGDQAGLMMSSDSVAVNLAPKADKSQYFRILSHLTDNGNYGGRRDLFTPLKELVNSKNQGVLFILSDFLNLTEEELSVIGLLSKKFDTYAFVIRDKVEKYLPSGINAVCIEDPKTHKTIIVNLKEVRQEYQELMEEDENRLSEEFLERNVDMGKFYTHKPFEGPLMEFFSRQKKQWK